MKKSPSGTAGKVHDGIAAEVRKLHATQQRLQELTVGEVDAVIHPGGHAYLLHQAQEQLRQSEGTQRHLVATQMALLNALPAQIALLDSEGIIISANDKWRQSATNQKLQGPEFDVGRNYLEICARAVGECSKEARAAAVGIRQVLQGELEIFSIEYGCQSPTEPQWFRLVAAPAQESGHAGAVIMHIDITEAKLSEQQLLWKSAFFEAQVQSALDGILVVDAHGQKILQNQRMIDLWNIPEEFAHEADHRRRFAWCASQVKNPGPFIEKVTYLYDHPDEISQDEIELSNGKWFDRYSAPVRGREGKNYGRIWTFRDITERKRIEARFRLLVDSNVQGVIFWKRSGEVTGANDAFLRLVHHTREDLEAGRINWAVLTPPEYAHLDRRCLEEIDTRGFGGPYEKEFVLQNGTRLPVLVGAASFADNPDEGVCFVLDLTERKKLEQQFFRAQRMESIGTLAGGIAHDLNNILAPIMMSINLLKDFVSDPEGNDILETISVSATRGAEIVRQVLSFARGVESEHSEVQPRHLLKDLENIMKDTFPKDIRLKFVVPNNAWTILGDPTQIHQILLNLCVNARDAMPQGGNLTVAVENCTLDEQYASMNLESKAGRYVQISVTDSGMGMTREVIDKIFEPFFTTKEVNKGTGLGLSTVMAIVKSHEGMINVYSEPGKGTTFKVYLPSVRTSSKTGQQQTGKIPLMRGNGETVLVVDDEPSIIAVTTKTLQAFGYHVLSAGNGAEAVGIYAANMDKIAVVLTDMTMPVMEGSAMIHALRRINPYVKVIAASGLNANGSASKISLPEVKHFLTKPYTAQTLLHVLHKILEEG